MVARAPIGIACLAFVLGCGDGGTANVPANDCANFAGTYNVTTEIVSTNCPAGLHTISQPVTWTFAQTAPSCRFTMSNLLYPNAVYTGYFTMQGTAATVTWTSVSPAPVVAAHALSYTSETLTIHPAAGSASGTVSGSFAWNSAYPCSGTTNVCSGTIAAGCATPN